jgi:hypothetical protein
LRLMFGFGFGFRLMFGFGFGFGFGSGIGLPEGSCSFTGSSKGTTFVVVEVAPRVWIQASGFRLDFEMYGVGCRV